MVTQTTNHAQRRPSSGFFRLPSLPTTEAGTDLGLVLVFLAVRVTDLIQLAVATPSSLSSATRPGLDAILIIGWSAYSIALAVRLIRTRRYHSTLLASLDVAAIILVFALEPAFTHTADRPTSWVAWAYPVSVSTAIGAGIGFVRRRDATIAMLALAIVYTVVTYPGIAPDHRSTVITNSLAYVGFTLAAALLAGYIRRLGAAADTARVNAARSAEEAEFERHRRLLHDQASVLGHISGTDLDPAREAALRQQAAKGAREIRAFLGQKAGAGLPDSPPVAANLVTAITAAAGDFPDLPIDLSVELAARTTIDNDQGRAVSKALTALLHNIRTHADANHITIHADDHNGHWEITLTDDGRGFDPTTIPLGYGLTTQAGQTLEALGITRILYSRPGIGTRITLTGTAITPAETT